MKNNNKNLIEGFRIKKWSAATVVLIVLLFIVVRVGFDIGLGYLKSIGIETYNSQFASFSRVEYSEALGEDFTFTYRVDMMFTTLEIVLRSLLLCTFAGVCMIVNHGTYVKNTLSVVPENKALRISMLAVVIALSVLPCLLVLGGIFENSAVLVYVEILSYLLIFVVAYYMFGIFLARKINASKKVRLLFPTLLAFVCEGISIIVYGFFIGIPKTEISNFWSWLESFSYIKFHSSGNAMDVTLGGNGSWTLNEVAKKYGQNFIDSLKHHDLDSLKSSNYINNDSIYVNNFSIETEAGASVNYAEVLDRTTFGQDLVENMFGGIIPVNTVTVIISYALIFGAVLLFAGLLYQMTRNVFLGIAPSFLFLNLCFVSIQQPSPVLIWLCRICLVAIVASIIAIIIKLIRDDRPLEVELD